MKTALDTRISRKFRALSEAGELGLVAYVTAGDPTLDATEKIVLASAAAGADVIELGVPFSDPVADGPTIQRASERALASGTTLESVLGLLKRIRAKSDVPIVLFSYFNPMLQMGLGKFAAAAAQAGADGVLATDLTPEEAGDYRAALEANGLDAIFLVAPTTSDARLGSVAEASSGFLYLISRNGITGAQDALPADLPALVRRVRKSTKLPVAVGFGISQPTHVTVLGGLADAAVVGSALVAEIEKAGSADAAAIAVAAKIASLKGAASKGVSRRSFDAP
ncbi:MAG: tryptophan synthase subunit alpha [Candidatus Acidiferrales bacterium]